MLEFEPFNELVLLAWFINDWCGNVLVENELERDEKSGAFGLSVLDRTDGFAICSAGFDVISKKFPGRLNI